MKKETYMHCWRRLLCKLKYNISSPGFFRAIVALLFILVYSKIIYVDCKIIRVDHHFYAPFTLIDSNRRLAWREPNCVQNLTDQANVQQCVSACVLNKNCTTLNYHHEKKICELLNMSKFDSLGILKYQPGWVHYETDRDVRLMGPLCYQLKPCKPYEVCKDTFTTTLYTCRCRDGFNGAEGKYYIGPGSTQNDPAPTCSLLMKRYKTITNGEYWIKRYDGTAVQKNCTSRTENGIGAKRPVPTVKSTTVPHTTKTPGATIIGAEQTIANDKLLTTLDTLPKEFTISFDFFPQDQSGWGHVLQFIVGSSTPFQHGDQIPDVYYEAENQRLRVYFDGIPGGKKDINNVQVNTWHTIKITQMLIGNRYRLSMWLNEQKANNLVNSDAREFHNVRVYATESTLTAQVYSRGNLPQRGKIRNLFKD